MKTEVLIVGGGFSGLSAGITLARANRKVVLVDSGSPRNISSEHAHGFLGMDGKNPGDILATGREEFVGFGGTLVSGTVEDLQRSADGCWHGRVLGGDLIESRACFVSTGLTDILPDIDGLAELWGKYVYHCPYCHGFEVSGSKCAVVGGNNRGFTLHQALLMKSWASEVDFITNGMELSSEERERLSAWGVEIVDAEVNRVMLTGDHSKDVELFLSDSRRIVYGSVFVGPEFSPNDRLLRDAGCSSEGLWIPVGQNGETELTGLWAGGNCVSSPDQIANAVSSGAKAAISINHAIMYSDLEILQQDRKRAGSYE